MLPCFVPTPASSEAGLSEGRVAAEDASPRNLARMTSKSPSESDQKLHSSKKKAPSRKRPNHSPLIQPAVASPLPAQSSTKKLLGRRHAQMSPMLLKPKAIADQSPQESVAKDSLHSHEHTISTYEGSSPIPKMSPSPNPHLTRGGSLSSHRDSHRVLSLLDKKLEYSNKVRALFRPRIDPLKQVEAQLARFKIEAQGVPQSPRAQLKKSTSLRLQPFMPAPQPNYLADRRKIRARVESVLLQRSRTDVGLRAPCSPDRRETLLNRMLQQKPHDLGLLEADLQLNEEYLANIKAKLQLLS